MNAAIGMLDLKRQATVGRTATVDQFAPDANELHLIDAYWRAANYSNGPLCGL